MTRNFDDNPQETLWETITCGPPISWEELRALLDKQQPPYPSCPDLYYPTDQP